MIPVDRLRVDDVRLVLRTMLDTVRIAEHPMARAKSMLAGLCNVLSARSGLYATAGGHGADGKVQWDWLVEAGVAGAPASRRWITVTAPQDSRCAADFEALCHAAERRAGAGGNGISPARHVPGAGALGSLSGNGMRKATDASMTGRGAAIPARAQNIGLCRWAEDPPFDGHDLAILELVHFEIGARLFDDPAANLHRSLTPRLCEVLELLLKGMGTKQISSKLGLSRYTVQDYAKEIYGRFGVHGCNELHARFHKADSRR